VTGSPARVGLRMPRGANLECDIVLQSAAPAVLNGIPGLGPIHLREVGRVRFDVPAVRDMLQRLVEGALESSGAEIEYKRERGETRFLMLNARRLPGPDGKRLPWWRLRTSPKASGRLRRNIAGFLNRPATEFRYWCGLIAPLPKLELYARISF
jgi:hypothetical protein